MAFSPDKIKTNIEPRAPFILLYAPNGHGKTTFVASIGSCFILDTEDKCNEIEGAFRYVPENFDDALSSLQYILSCETVPFKALVIDSIDWLEKQLHEKICSMYKVKSINDDSCKELNFSKGNVVAANMFIAETLPLLEGIRKRHNIPIVLCAQQSAVTIKDPEKGEYNVIDLRLQQKLAQLLSDKVEAKMYLQCRYYKDVKGSLLPTKERYLITNPARGISAKNSLHLPDEITVGEYTGWSDFVSKINTNRAERV